MTPTDVLVRAGWEDHGGVLVNPAARDITHPPKGTCTPGCPMWGECHCGCGERPAIAPNDSPGRVKGRPFALRAGHHSNHRGYPGHPPFPNRDAVPADRVRPLLDWLEDRYGSQAEVARLLDMDRMNYWKVRNRRHYLNARTWRRIKALVLAHRTPADRFATYEARRFAPREVQRQLDRDAASSTRRAQRYKRLGVDEETE